MISSLLSAAVVNFNGFVSPVTWKIAGFTVFFVVAVVDGVVVVVVVVVVRTVGVGFEKVDFVFEFWLLESSNWKFGKVLSSLIVSTTAKICWRLELDFWMEFFSLKNRLFVSPAKLEVGWVSKFVVKSDLKLAVGRVSKFDLKLEVAELKFVVVVSKFEVGEAKFVIVLKLEVGELRSDVVVVVVVESIRFSKSLAWKLETGLQPPFRNDSYKINFYSYDFYDFIKLNLVLAKNVIKCFWFRNKLRDNIFRRSIS